VWLEDETEERLSDSGTVVKEKAMQLQNYYAESGG
jgi:hypothetical protein